MALYHVERIGLTWKFLGISTESLCVSDKKSPRQVPGASKLAFPTVLNLRVERLQGGRRQLPLLNQFLNDRFEGLELRL